MKPKILNDITNIFAKWAGSKDYDPKVKYDTALEFYANEVPVLPKPKADDTGKSPVVKSDGSYELKIVGDANAVHYTPDTGKTDAQKAQARTNIGAAASSDIPDVSGLEPKKLIVTVTESGGVYSADKTYEEITDAISDGKTVDVIYNSGLFHLQTNDPDWVVFVSVNESDVDYANVAISILSTDDSNEWQYYHGRFVQATTTVIDRSSTSITLASAADNTIYQYGELSALTITAITATGDFIIRFTSGATATTTNFPATMKFPEAFAPEANTRYEINCSNGYALVASWPVS